jgi:Ala-tRNA(Pro) deacylase
MNDRLREMLTRAGASFEVITHPEVYTAQERAAACRITGRRLAKVVVVRDGDWFGLAVIPAAAQLDIDQLGEYLRVEAPAIASVAASPPAA